MPRTRRTESGAPVQSDKTGAPGVRYGEGQDLAEMRAAAPIPNNRAATPSPRQAPQTGLPAEAGVPSAPPMPKPGLLTAPSTRPHEAITAGLSSGPGPGPEILGVNPTESPTGRLLRDLARITGRDDLAKLARRNGL